MKTGRFEVYFGELLVGYFPSLFVLAWIQISMDLEAHGCCGRADEVHDDFISLQGLALPVSGYVAEQPMLDFIPLAGPRRLMADFDNPPRGLG